MRIASNYELEHRGPLVFSQTAAAVFLLSIFIGAFIALVIHAGISEFIPLFLLVVVASTAILLGVRSGQRLSTRQRSLRGVSSHILAGQGGAHQAPGDPPVNADLFVDLSEYLEATPSLIGIVEIQGERIGHIYDNPAASRFFALTGDARSNHSATPQAFKSLESIWLEQCQESKARNAPIHFEFQTERPGQRRWYSATIFPIRDGGHNSDKFAYQAENITAVKENESALLEARERLEAALEVGSLATWDWDIQRDVVYGDSVLIELYGVPADYIRGVPVSKFLEHIHADDRMRVQQLIKVALESGDIYAAEYRIVSRGGQQRWVSATGRVIKDGTGKPTRFPGVTIDITHLKEVETALHEATITSRNQLQELEAVYTYAPVGLAVVSPKHLWLRVNKVMAEYFGKSPSDHVGKPISDLLPTIAEEFDRQLAEAIRTRQPVLNVEMSGECLIRPGSVRTWRANFYPLVSADDTVTAINIVMDDITEERRAVEEHRAHRAILGVVSPDEPLERVLNSLSEAIDGIFPGATSYILRDHEGARPIAPLPRAAREAVQRLFSPPLSKEELKVITDVIDSRAELLIPDVTERNDVGFIGRVRQAGYRSCWIKPIILSDGEVWGACAIHHPSIKQNPTQGERDHLDVLVRLAATVIERKAFLDKLTATTERLQLAERAGRIGVFDWNPQTGKVIWTPQLEESFGIAQGSFEGTYEGWRKRVHSDDVGALTDHLNGLMQRKEKSFAFDYRIVRPNGEVRWSSDEGAITYDVDGRAIRMIGVAIDTTERKKIEQQGARIQERLNLALEAGNLGLWDWHIPTGAVHFGGNWASMLGLRSSEIEPHVRSWESLVHPDDKAYVTHELQRHLAGETPVYEVEHRLRTRDGSWIWILDRGRVVERDSSGKPLRAVGIHADIHEQRMIREKLNSEARRKDEFLAILAHELRNPLAPLRTGLEILRRNPEPHAAEQARDMMSRQLLHMVRLIEDLLDISRISLGRLELRFEKITIREVIEAALENSRPAIEAAKHEVSVHIPSEEISFKGDLARLSQVLANLLINAAKYTPPAGKIRLEAHVEAKDVVVRIIDSGIGIPANKLDEIFEMFSQVYSPLDRTQGGLGIGLALVRRLVAKHGGTVSAESAGLGLGSTFTVRLPLECEGN